MEILEILVYVALALSVINLGISIFIIRRIKFNEYRMKNQIGQGGQADGVVFCKKCSNKYSSALQKCPSCGALRR